jgi:hypothetical protein
MFAGWHVCWPDCNAAIALAELPACKQVCLAADKLRSRSYDWTACMSVSLFVDMQAIRLTGRAA